MRTRPSSPVLALLTALLALSGCGVLGIGGPPDLTNLEVAGRYRFTKFEINPASGAVRDYKVLGREVRDDLTLKLDESGAARLETLRGDRVDRVESQGSYTISGRTVRVRFDDDVEDYLLPREIEFEGGGERLRAEVFREGLDMERISDDYRGITRADATLQIELREI